MQADVRQKRQPLIVRCCLYVAFADKECVGFYYIIPKGAFHSFPYLHLIVVKEEYRGKGIGRVLLEHSENIAFKTANKLFLVVEQTLSNGFCRVGEIPSLYRQGISEFLMMKEKTS